MTMHLSKSAFMDGKKCERLMMLKKLMPQFAAPLSESAIDRINTGKIVGEEARKLFPEGVLVSAYREEAVEETQRLLDAGTPVIFEGAVSAHGFLAKFDVLRRLPEGGFEILEVKSSKNAKTEHFWDLGFQVWVARQAGLDIRSMKLALINGNYSHGGVECLFVFEDASAKVEKELPKISQEAERLKGLMAQGNLPDRLMDKTCLGCDFFEYCLKQAGHDPIDDVMFLHNFRKPDILRAREAGRHRITELDPKGLSELQGIIRQALVTGEHRQKDLAPALRRFTEPIHFVDFEAVSFAIPTIEGVYPYLPLTFQWSCHVTDRLGRILDHKEFLHDGKGDPRIPFAESLWNQLKDAGTVVVYSLYEEHRVGDLAKFELPNTDRLQALFAERQIDLCDLLREHYYHPGFKGSFSIKAVLPALAPSMDYSDLEIKDGLAAAVAYRKMADASPAEAAALRDSLLKYCHRDTEAMVVVYRHLLDLA